MLPYLRFRYRRQTRRLRRRFLHYRERYNRYADSYLRGKGPQFVVARRFITVWTALVVFGVAGTVGQIVTQERLARVSLAVSGGDYSEAAVGTVTVVNPILPDDASADVDRLIFDGLTRINDSGNVAPDLATSWDISPDGRTYTFHLRHNVKWQDGVGFNATDVAFTFAAIQNPDSRSPLASSWQGVKVTAKDTYTVQFVLPSPLASFLPSTTQGIVPRHLLESVDPSSLREASFNQQPIGTGAFTMKTFAPAAHEITLAASTSYFAGRPKIDEFTFHYYDTSAEAFAAYQRREVLSPGQLTASTVASATRETGLNEYDLSLPEETAVFFNTVSGLTTDPALRLALSRVLDRSAIVTAVNNHALALSQPLLPGETGYTAAYAPTQLTDAEANAALTAAGYVAGKNGVREKSGQKLQFTLVTSDDPELVRVAGLIKQAWAPLGVVITVSSMPIDQLEQSFMRPRHFQMLLYGLNTGNDPDVYAFWHSSQAADPGVNLSQYASTSADRALEAGRITTDPAIRRTRYAAFLRQWNTDAPAAVLFQSVYMYAVSNQVQGITIHRLVTGSDRLADVRTWTIRTQLVPRY